LGQWVYIAAFCVEFDGSAALYDLHLRREQKKKRMQLLLLWWRPYLDDMIPVISIDTHLVIDIVNNMTVYTGLSDTVISVND
jgi:hypothetical protein